MPLIAARIDFETFSAAGCEWDADRQRWVTPTGARKKGIVAVGTLGYAQDPTTRIITLSYKLPGGLVRRWQPGQPLPSDLFAWIAAGGLVEAHHVMMERAIWEYVARPRHAFPPLPAAQLRCSSATAKVNNYPGALENLSQVVDLPIAKDSDGTRLINKFSMPRNLTKHDARWRILPEDDPEDAERFYAYCDTDVLTEDALAYAMPPMTDAELRAWQIDQAINWRGVGVDEEGVDRLIGVMEELYADAYDECERIADGLTPSQVAALLEWLDTTHKVALPTLDVEAVERALARTDLPDDARRVLELRQATASASVKKLYAMQRGVTPDGRLKGLYFHHGARTGRPTGADTQPTNMFRGGPSVRWCESCERPSGTHRSTCGWCGSPRLGRVRKWASECVDHVLAAALAGRRGVEWIFGDVLLAISGCTRGMFVAAPGHDLIASDYSAIEAVVLAMLANEEWKIEAFLRDDPVYLMVASGITGIPVEEYLVYAEEHGDDHPHRQTYGKTADLAGGFGGWIGAYKAFDDSLPDETIKEIILGWRARHPCTVEFWGGQTRGMPWEDRAPRELYGLEGGFIQAMDDPNRWHSVNRHVAFRRLGDDVWMRLPSGREICYHDVSDVPNDRWPHLRALRYKGWNTNPKMGAPGWVSLNTYSGRLAENVTQATAHDIQRHGLQLLEARGYPIVLHVYDENIAEVPQGFGSIEEFERIMSTMPGWAAGWPIRAKDGWRGRRYRKG